MINELIPPPAVRGRVSIAESTVVDSQAPTAIVDDWSDDEDDDEDDDGGDEGEADLTSDEILVELRPFFGANAKKVQRILQAALQVAGEKARVALQAAEEQARGSVVRLETVRVRM